MVPVGPHYPSPMDGAPLSHTRARLLRMRWRRAGAWLWPSFVALTVVDAAVGHLLPPVGSSETLVAAGLLGLVANLLGVILLARPMGWLVRHVRHDVPAFIARDYGGTVVVLAVTSTLAIVGLVHRPLIQARHRATQDAIARAQAWIGDRAPPEFRRNLQYVSLLAIQSDTIYRACVPSLDRTKSYCVIVDRSRPFAHSVRFSGYESNSVMGAGTG